MSYKKASILTFRFMKAQSIVQKEELFNVLTHGLGILFGFLSIPFLIYYAFSNGNLLIAFGSIIYSLTFLFVYTASTFYHAFNKPSRKALWRKVDHISIYFMISGSYTPFILKYMYEPRGIILLGALWFLTLVGIFFKIFNTGKFDNISTIIYLLMGWSVLFVAKTFFTVIPTQILMLIGLGGLLYTVGVLFYKMDKLPFNHGIWHLFVLGAGVAHFFGVFLSIL